MLRNGRCLCDGKIGVRIAGIVKSRQLLVSFRASGVEFGLGELRMLEDARINIACVLIRFPIILLAVACDTRHVVVVAVRRVISAAGSECKVSRCQFARVVGLVTVTFAVSVRLSSFQLNTLSGFPACRMVVEARLKPEVSLRVKPFPFGRPGIS